MNKDSINTHLPNKNKWKSLSITTNATKQILYLINSDSNNIGIRLSIKKSGCAGFRYTMTLVKKEELYKQNNKEITFLYKNIYIYINSKDIPFLQGIKIDFIKNNINKAFTFHNPKLEKFCGCGESFSIE